MQQKTNMFEIDEDLVPGLFLIRKHKLDPSSISKIKPQKAIAMLSNIDVNPE